VIAELESKDALPTYSSHLYFILIGRLACAISGMRTHTGRRATVWYLRYREGQHARRDLVMQLDTARRTGIIARSFISIFGSIVIHRQDPRPTRVSLTYEFSQLSTYLGT
jgi:hypothetical protein